MMIFEVQPRLDLKLYIPAAEYQEHCKRIKWSLRISEEGVEKQSIEGALGKAFFSFDKTKKKNPHSFQLLQEIDSRYETKSLGRSSLGGGENVLHIMYRVESSDGVLSLASVIMEKITNELSHIFQNTYFLPITRGILKWDYEISQTMPNRVLAEDEGHSTVNLLHFMISSRYEDEMRDITKWAEKFGISSLKAYPRDVSSLAARSRPEIPFSGLESFDDTLKMTVEVAAKGFGSRQVLPIIVQSIIAPPGSIILIEEPEIHLHPKLQGEIVEFFVDCIQKDRQLLVTTHSEHLIARLQTLIASGKLSAEDVRVFEVSKEQSGTKIQQVTIAEDGGMELPTFFEVNKEEMARFLEALKEKPE
jgi:hypothetical protein